MEIKVQNPAHLPSGDAFRPKRIVLPQALIDTDYAKAAAAPTLVAKPWRRRTKTGREGGPVRTGDYTVILIPFLR
jgi:hypothetical protein